MSAYVHMKHIVYNKYANVSVYDFIHISSITTEIEKTMRRERERKRERGRKMKFLYIFVRYNASGHVTISASMCLLVCAHTYLCTNKILLLHTKVTFVVIKK